MSRHALDRPIWNALSTHQLKFALGSDRARRFAPEIGPLASAKDDGVESLSDLAELIPSSGSLILLQADQIVIPDGVEAIKIAPGVQMVLENLVRPPDDLRDKIERLKENDTMAW